MNCLTQNNQKMRQKWDHKISRQENLPWQGAPHIAVKKKDDEVLKEIKSLSKWIIKDDEKLFYCKLEGIFIKNFKWNEN